MPVTRETALPYATLRLLEPIGDLPVGTELTATAIIRAAGLVFFEVLPLPLIEASKVEVTKWHS